jgi:arabinofuranan 3-O-arabinosyltransferase
LDAHGRGIPTDFINVWSAGKLALDGHPALARDWDIQKQGVFGLVRFSGASEQLAWALQWAMTATVAVGTVLLWRLMTPYLFLYDMTVLAIPIAWPVRIGLADGFQKFELPALGCAALLLLCFPFFEAPIGLGGTLTVAALIVRRLPVFQRKGLHAVDRTDRDLSVVGQS